MLAAWPVAAVGLGFPLLCAYVVHRRGPAGPRDVAAVVRALRRGPRDTDDT